MALTKDRKTGIIGTYRTHDSDTGSPGSPGRAAQRSHQLPHRAFQDSREGSPFAPRPAQAGRPAPASARLSEEQGLRALRGTDPPPRHPQVMSSTKVPYAQRQSAEARDPGRIPHDLHRNRQARQAGRRRACIVRSGDTMVLVTACHAASPRVGIDFLPLTVDYREYTYAVGTHPRRVLQARRQAARKGNPHQPPDRPPDPPALPRRLALRDADHRARASRPTPRTIRRARHHRRVRGAGALGNAVPEDHRRRARRPDRRQLRDQPDATTSASRARSTSSSPAATTASSWSRPAPRK